MDTKDALAVLTAIVHGIGRDLTPEDDFYYRLACAAIHLKDMCMDTPENREAVLALMELVYPSGS
jgi:hypothetical protein